MAVTRLRTSSILNSFPKFQNFWDGSASTSPVLVSGLYTWYDASDASTITITDGNISQWNDKSPNGRHATQTNASQRPTLSSNIQNGLSVVSFNGTTSGMTSNISLTQNALTGFIVYRRNSGGNDYGRAFSLRRQDNEDYNTTDSFEIHASAVSFNSVTPPLIGGYRNSSAIGSIPISYGTPYLMHFTLNGTSFNINNSGSTASGTTESSSINATLQGIGSDGKIADRSLNGWIGEHILYNRVLTTQEINNIRSYLSTKWGVS